MQKTKEAKMKQQKVSNRIITNLGAGHVYTKGITLISLVITIIVMLILASVAINLTLSDNGIFTKAKEAREKMERAMLLEKIQTEILEKQLASKETGINKGELETILGKYGDPQKDEEENVTGLKPEGKEEIIPIEQIIGNTKIIEGANVEDLFDETGTKEGKLHIGDFINYSAGIWKDTDMTTIAETGVAPNNSTEQPSTSYQFGGFAVGGSKDGNAPPYNTSYAYVQDKATGSAVTGWRLFDVSDGVMTLISAGCPEDYYHPNGTNFAYISEYLLTGNVNSRANATNLGLGTTYKARNWNMYVNSNYGATSASVLTKAKLDAWYTKYTTNTASVNTYDNTTFQKIYKTSPDCVNNGMYETLIDNYSCYWLSAAYLSHSMSFVRPSSMFIDCDGYNRAYGVRVLVSLSSEVKLSEKAVGTKTVESRSNEYTYNVWNLVTK